MWTSRTSGNASSALLFVRHRDLRSPDIRNDMKDYCKRDRMCRRHFLAAYFEMDFSVISPKCCDICAGNCACSNCLCSTFPVELYLLLWNRMTHGAEKAQMCFTLLATRLAVHNSSGKSKIIFELYSRLNLDQLPEQSSQDLST